eukprot:1721167-Rhodomonas_salina.3
MLRQTLAAAATHYRSAAVVRSRLGAVAGKRAMSSSQGEEAAVLAAVHDVLEAAGTGDWAKYEPLCDKDITCFEPESVGNVAKGLPFHKFYFNMPAGGSPRPIHNKEISSCSPVVSLRWVCEHGDDDWWQVQLHP